MIGAPVFLAVWLARGAAVVQAADEPSAEPEVSTATASPAWFQLKPSQLRGVTDGGQGGQSAPSAQGPGAAKAPCVKPKCLGKGECAVRVKEGFACVACGSWMAAGMTKYYKTREACLSVAPKANCVQIIQDDAALYSEKICSCASEGDCKVPFPGRENQCCPCGMWVNSKVERCLGSREDCQKADPAGQCIPLK